MHQCGFPGCSLRSLLATNQLQLTVFESFWCLRQCCVALGTRCSEALYGTRTTRERGILVLVRRSAMRVEDEDPVGRWRLIEFTLVVLMVGFALGHLWATRRGKVRTDSPDENKPIVKFTVNVGTQSAEIKKRTVGAQSQCTYKRKSVTPRFHVLPVQAGGVFYEDVGVPLSELFDGTD